MVLATGDEKPTATRELADGARRTRGRPPRINRDLIAKTACELVDEVGLEGLTLKAVAGRLDVTSMALYHHIADREELIDLVVDRIISRTLFPPYAVDGADWKDTVRASLERLRDALDHESVILESFLRQPFHPNNVALARQLLNAFRHAGLSSAGALDAFTLTTSFVVGFTAVGHGLGRVERRAPASSPEITTIDQTMSEYGSLHRNRDAAFDAVVDFILDLIARSAATNADHHEPG